MVQHGGAVCVSEEYDLLSVIFDLDGTILDSMPAHVAAWRSVGREFGLELDEAFLYRNEGNLDWESLIKSFRPSKPDWARDDFMKLLGRQQEVYLDQYADSVSVYPEAVPLLERLKASGTRTAIVTSSRRRVLSEALRDWLDRYFACVITGDQVSRSKPHPEPYLKALGVLGLNPGQAVAVENAPAGIRSARRAGLTCLGLATTLPQQELKEADLVLDGHRELDRWLANELQHPGERIARS